MNNFYKDLFFQTSDYNYNKNYRVINKDNEIIVKVLTPELEKKDISVELKKDLLIINNIKEEKSEFLFNNFKNQKFKLLKEVNSEKISAKLESGVLTIKMPLSEKSQAKKIEIN